MTVTRISEPAAARVDLRVDLAGIPLRHPVLVAAGCGGTGPELAAFVDLVKTAAFVTRSVSLQPVTVGLSSRVVETPSGVLSPFEGDNPGIDAFLADELPWLVGHGATTVVSVAAATLREYGELARRLSASPGVSGVEVSLAARNAEVGGRPFGADPYHAAKATAAVRQDTSAGRPVLVKLIPDVHSIVDVARAVIDAGADGVVLVDGPRGMAVDIDSGRPLLGAGTGRLGGPAVHPLAVRCVWEVHEAFPDLPIVGVGGIRSGTDALEMLLAGAQAVQVGSATIADPSAPVGVARELATALARRGITSVAQVGR